MDIYIDDKKIEVRSQSQMSITLDIEDMLELESQDTTTEYVRFEMPFTPNNMAIMGDSEQALSTTMFNQTTHAAYVERDGSKVIWGRAFLVESAFDQNGGYYVVAIRPYPNLWEQKAATTLIHKSEIDYQTEFVDEVVYSSWFGDQMVRYLPVKNNVYTSVLGGNIIIEVMTTMDYYPFIHVASFFRHVAENSGYTIESEFVDSEYFDSLHFSGQYISSNCDTLKERMDFMAARKASSTTTASSQGIVYASPYYSSNSVGNIVDVIAPIIDGEDILFADAFSNEGCFDVSGVEPIFTPSSTVTMAFEYQLSYVCGYSLLDRNSLKCVDTITLHDGLDVNYGVANPFSDMREVGQLESSYSYRVVLFEYDYAATYKLTADTSLGQYDQQLVEFTGTSSLFTTSSNCTYSNMKLWIKQGGDYGLCDSDWAIYKGAFDLTGDVSVNITVRSKTKEYSSGSPVYFNGIKFSGGVVGSSFTLADSITIKPLFLNQPALGSDIKWSEITAHELYQIDIFEAIAQMYDLKFYTDNSTKKIFIEPYCRMVDSGKVVDFTNIVDVQKPTTVSEMGHDMYNRIELEYSTGDGYVSRWNVNNDQTMGYWDTEIQNVFSNYTLEREKSVVFTPSLNSLDMVRYAASAQVLQVGARDSYGQQNDYSEDLNFPIKIVRYLGMKPLEAGESWGWPSYGNEYPFAAFHFKGDVSYTGEDDVNELSVDSTGQQAFDNGFSLCFEDRDKLAGLHRYHEHRADRYNKSKMITQYLFLSPDDMERMIVPNSQQHDWRALYKINVHGEDILCRLLSIEGYNPDAWESTKCVFIKEV